MTRRRQYRMEKRADAAGETRRRIVETCFSLHLRQGIAGTTMTQIAEAAGVSVGTVYHHFPRYEDAVAACSAHAEANVPLPGPQVLAGHRALADRLEALALAWFDIYERLQAFALIRAESDRYEPIRDFVEREVANRRALVRIALEPINPDDRTVKLAAALLDVAVYDELREGGFSTASAARSVAALIAAGLKGQTRRA